MRRLPLAALALASVAAFAIACSAESSSEVGTNEAANTEARPLIVLKGREWGRCWFDVTGDQAQLSCTSTKRAEGDPLATTLDVTAATIGAIPFSSASKVLDLEAGGTVVVGSFPRASFPVMILMKAQLPGTASEELGAKKFHDINNNFTVARPEDLAAAAPAVIKQPFDLWPTALIDPEGNGGFAMNATYETSIAPYESFLDEKVMPFDVGIFGRDVQGKIRWWAAPASGGIPVSINGPASVDATITGPGYYAVTASGLRQATLEEIAKDFPRGVDAGIGEGDASSPDETDGGTADATVDAGPPDLTPGCGGHGEAKCADGKCDPSHRYSGTVSTCLACGGDGETYCYGANDLRVCEPGHRYSGSDEKCHLCGSDGETYCWDANNQRACEPGHRYSGSDEKCHVCGADGQTYCWTASGQRACNDGHRYSGTTEKCHVCGGNGETYCWDANGQRVCDPGFKYVSASETCSPQ